MTMERYQWLAGMLRANILSWRLGCSFQNLYHQYDFCKLNTNSNVTPDILGVAP